MQDVSIVIPAFNEAGAITATVQEIRKFLNELQVTAEIIVVDDGSADSTSIEAREAGCVVISHPHNIGYGKSLKTGIQAASNDTVIITDADATYPPKHLAELLSMYGKGYDMVVGARRGDHYKESFLKLNLRMLLKFLVEFTAGRKIPDINSGMRVFSKKTILPYFNNLCDTFSFTTSLTLAYMMTSKFVTYVPIDYDKRIGNTKVRLFRDSLRTLQFIVEAILFYNPIKIFIVFSMMLVAVGVLLLVITFFLKLYSAFYLGIGFLLAAVFMFGLGLISVLMSKLLRTTKVF